VHRRVAIRVNAVVVGLDQVTLNVVESFHLDSTHFKFACPWSHRGVLSSVYELADSKDGHNTEILGKHESGEDDGDAGNECPLFKRVCGVRDNDEHGNSQEEELEESLDPVEVLHRHNVELDVGKAEADAKTVLKPVKARKQLGLQGHHEKGANNDLLAAVATGTNVGVLAHIQDVDEHAPERLRDYENPACFLSRWGCEVGGEGPHDVRYVLEVAEHDSNE